MKVKAQTSMELLILLSAVLFFIVVFLGIVHGNIADKAREKQNILVQEAALNVQNEINLALKSSEGYYREFEVPDKIANKEYNISIVENLVYIVTDDKKNSIALPVANITGNILKGNNVIRKQNNSIFLNV